MINRPDLKRKQMTKDRQKALAENQQAKEAVKAKRAQEILQKQNTKKNTRRVPNDNDNSSDDSDNSLQPLRLTGRGKASHPDQIKSSRGAQKKKKHNNDQNSNDPTNDNDEDYTPLIRDPIMTPDDSTDPPHDNDIGVF